MSAVEQASYAPRPDARHDKVDRALVVRASALIPALRARARETDALCRLPDATIKDLNDARLMELLTPRRYGGLQTNIATYKAVCAETGRGCGSAGWVVALTNICNWLAATLYPQQVGDEIFAVPGGLRGCGVLPPRKAVVRKVKGGFHIDEGLWGFNSGVYHANLDMLGIPVVDDDGKVIDEGLAIVPMEKVEILNDWDTIGLRGSGSSSVAVHDVFVPAERVASLPKAIQGQYGSAHLRGEQLYRLPFVPFLSLLLTFPQLGAGRGALDVFLDKSKARGIQYTSYDKQLEAPVTHLQVAEASAKLDAAEALIDRAIEAIEEAALTDADDMELVARGKVRGDAGMASQLIWEAVDALASGSGGSFAASGNLVNRYWRDVRIAGLHGVLCTTTSLELYGRLICGQQPNTPLV
jgi:3-hydroxy-9,10-secoandrosta-1,3,5(10)-triene-9,17-dione monooxygenase